VLFRIKLVYMVLRNVFSTN